MRAKNENVPHHSANDFTVEDPTPAVPNEVMAAIVENISSSERPTVRMRALKPTPTEVMEE